MAFNLILCRVHTCSFCSEALVHLPMCYCGLNILNVVHQPCFSWKQIQASLPDKMLGLIRPWASKLTTRSQGQGPYLWDKDPIPNVPTALTQCHFMWCLGTFGFLLEKKKPTLAYLRREMEAITLILITKINVTLLGLGGEDLVWILRAPVVCAPYIYSP